MANRVTRRQFMTRTGLAVGGVVLTPQILAACGGDDEGEGGSGSGSTDGVYFENWPEYIDTAEDGSVDGAGTTLANFTEQTGIPIKYTEVYNDNNEYFAKIQPLLSQGKAIAPNVLAPTYWMAARLINLGWVEKLPFDKIPNSSNLVTSLQKPPSDPTGEFSLPWQAGTAGIAYNINATGGKELTSVADLWDPSLKGKVSALTEMRDTIGIIALSEGIDISTANTLEDYEPAFATLKEQVDSGQIRQFTGNEYVGPLEEGSLAACFAWSGDVLGMNNPDIRYVVPDSGGTLWFDTMIIPKGASGVDDVAEWMNFVYDPVNAAQITAAVQFISPVQGVQDELRKMGGDAAALADNPYLFPDEATQERLHTFANLSDDEEAKMDEEFSTISGA
uniref:Putrescine ABC transporter putrescine-binding protein PotF n=1 Tax=uncultured bacterium A1Q1_fos_2286 TaxID=1256566 RepID=L7VYW6_9BACT|nr:putrescine ABC transporter putrescine-binding protein PotF [uncultured bacterium A1Q1_fos_2286]